MSKETNSPAKSAQLGLPTLIAMGTGQAIGAGVITSTGLAVGATGRATWLAYAAAVLLGFIIVLPYVFYCSTVRFKGGHYTMINSLIGVRWGIAFAIGCLPMFIANGTSGLAIGTYVNSMFPALNPRIVGIIALTLIYLLNIFGINIMAKVQNFLSTFLIICLVGFCLVGTGKLLPGSFEVNAPGYFLGGRAGFLSAIGLLMYGTTGTSLTIAYSAHSQNAKARTAQSN